MPLFLLFKKLLFIQIISSVQFFEHRNELKIERKKSFCNTTVRGGPSYKLVAAIHLCKYIYFKKKIGIQHFAVLFIQQHGK